MRLIAHFFLTSSNTHPLLYLRQALRACLHKKSMIFNKRFLIFIFAIIAFIFIFVAYGFISWPVVMGESALILVLSYGAYQICVKDFRAEISERDRRGNLIKLHTKDLEGLTRKLQEALQEVEYKNKILEDTKASTINLLEDVSAEKARAEILLNELNKFHLAVENSFEHVIITDLKGVIIYANKAAEVTTGYSRAEMLGQRPSLWGGQMSKEFYKNMWDVIAIQKKTFHAEVSNKRKNGHLYIAEMYISPILGKDGNIKFFVGIERDITEQKKLEDARTNFISVASHQLRTPITSIKWIAELMLGGDIGPLNKKQLDFLKDLYTSTDRMIKLVNSLLNIARIESRELIIAPERLNIKKRYTDILKELEPMAFARKHKFTFSNETGLSEFISDPNLFHEILKNLFSNSIKYTPDGGLIEFSCSTDNNDIVFLIKDNGIGIPKNQQVRIFDKFFRADNVVRMNTDGTGLGMFIVKELIELLEGRIWFESEEDRGTAMHVALPLRGPHHHKGSKNLIDVE